MSQKSVPTAARVGLIVVPAVLAMLVLSGCDPDTYPQDLSYPVRTDPIYPETLIKDLNKSQPQQIDRPGQFPAIFAQVDSASLRNTLHPLELPAGARQSLQASLTQMFGTPAQPKVDGIAADAVTALRLEPARLEFGGRMYRKQCLHCHGMTGDGRGPTGPWVNPHPRDYRLGRFKFTSSSQDEGRRKPRREDLLRTLREGIEGTSMPAFRLLPEDDLEALASYVIHLSLRGEAEVGVIQDLFSNEISNEPNAIAEQLKAYQSMSVGNWQDADKSAIQPGPFQVQDAAKHKESSQRGFKLFIEKGQAGCIGCHLNFGRQNNFTYDVWGTITRPADVTQSVYRGGRRPIDLYYRIHSGINGSGMTAFGKELKPDQIWDLVNFLQVLPYQKMRQEYGINID